jgi:hypothetical protein
MSLVRPTLFISHSRSDNGFFQTMSDDIHKAGINCLGSDSAERFEELIVTQKMPGCTIFCAYLTSKYLRSERCMQELTKAIESKHMKIVVFADSDTTVDEAPALIKDEFHCQVVDNRRYLGLMMELSAKAWASLQIRHHLVPSENHILAGPAIFDTEGYTRKDLINKVKSELILAASNLRSWLSDAESRKQLVDLVKRRRIRVTLILSTYEALRPISTEGVDHLRQSVDDIKQMFEQLTEEERLLMKVYFHIGATTLSAVFIDPESPDGILFFSPRWAIQFLPQDRCTCVIDKTRNSPDLFKAIYNSVFLMTQRDAKSVDDMLPGKTIFISYRRADSADITARLTDKLTEKFGKGFVFKDVDSIISGSDFKTQIEQAVKKCNIFVAVIGRHWAGAQSETGNARLDNENDFVRLEVEAALHNGIPVIPVLVHEAPMPPAHALPSSLGSLALRQAILLHGDPLFHRDADRLIRDIETHLKSNWANTVRASSG